MQIDHSKTVQIQREKREISRCAGLLGARALLLVLLFLSTPWLSPVSVYLFLFLLFVPWVISNILSAHTNKEMQPILQSCSKKFFYTPERLRAEKLTKNAILFFLLVWQLAANQNHSLPATLSLTPAFLLLLYLFTKALFTIYIRFRIHHFYMNFEAFD